jgi:hypothetical protein
VLPLTTFNSSRQQVNIVFTKYDICTLIDQFLPLTIEIFGCLHKHVNVLFHDCANAIGSLKGPKGPHISTLVIFLCQKISITLQRMQMSSILSQAVVVSLTTSQLPPLQATLPSPWSIYCKPLIWPTYHRWSVMDMERF